MDKRIVFFSNEICNLFFQKVLQSFSMKNWKDLRSKFNIPKSTFEFYKNGRFSLPEKLYNQISFKLLHEDLNFFESKLKRINSNWGSVKAGKITYGKYKDMFDIGRKKAIESAQRKANKFNINIPLNNELAYFIGLFIGDGFTNKYYTHYIVQFVGDTRYEKEFYKIISGYTKRTFNLTPIVVNSKSGNWFRFNLYSKNLFEMITQRFKISAGEKTRTVLIPEEILNASPNILKSCLRGLYDAEGCVFLDKRPIYKKPYPRIDLHMSNKGILRQVHEVLNKFSIKNELVLLQNNFRVVIWGFEEVKRFMKEIGFMNPKQLKKLELLKD